MISQLRRRRGAAVAVAALVFAVAGCGAEQEAKARDAEPSSPPRPSGWLTVVERHPIVARGEFVAAQEEQTGAADAKPFASAPRQVLAPLAKRLRHRFTAASVESVSVRYETVALRHGQWARQVVSARFVLPIQGDGARDAAVPLISLQHPTQPLRSQSPSLVPWQSDRQGTVPLAYLLAFMGYAVVVPDYPGLGVNTDPHPFCLRSVAASVRDAIHAVVATPALWPTAPAAPATIRWDGRVFLMGYSEGGYATMVAAQALQAEGTRVDGAAVLGAPLSLSQAMRAVLLREDAPPDAVYPYPYFLPYLLAGYADHYVNRTPPVRDFEFADVVRASVPGYPGDFAAALEAMLGGEHSEDEISAFMRLAKPYEGPRSILTKAFLERLRRSDPTQQPYRALLENDPFRGWVPMMPLLLAHHVDDETVPYENTALAAEAFQGLPNVEVQVLRDAVPGLSTVHSGAAPLAYARAVQWIDARAHPDRRWP